MGDIADYLNEIGEELWLDHCLGHPTIPDQCPYCENNEEFQRDWEAERQEMGKME